MQQIEWRRTAPSIAIGVAAALLVVFTVSLIGFVSSAAGVPGQTPPPRQPFTLAEYLIGGLLQSSFLYAAIETCVFVFSARITRIQNKKKLNTVLFLTIILTLGWILHGATLLSMAKALGFFVLALWYRRILVRSNELNAAFFTFLAHASWNATVFSIWALRAVTVHTQV